MGNAYYGERWEQISPATLPTGWFFNPFQPYPYTRYTTSQALAAAHRLDHPANIRQVRLTVISRSSVPELEIRGEDLLLRPDGTPYLDGPQLRDGSLAWRHLENLSVEPVVSANFRPVGGGYYRFILRQSITPKNLLMSRQFIIPVNLGGG
jgi:type IV pilus assembly protein PilW